MQGLYATRFDVVSTGVPEDAYRELVAMIADWAWRGVGSAPDVLTGGSGSAAAGSFRMAWQVLAPEGTTERATTIELRHPDSSRAGLEWSTWFEVVRTKARLRVTVRLSREATELALVPAALDLHRPSIVAGILSRYTCVAGGVPLAAEALTLAPDAVDGFVDTLLTSTSRALPVVVLTPPTGGQFVAAPDRVADELAGMAHVAALSGHLAWQRLAERLPRDLMLPPGGARLYWPGFGTDEQLRHRFWTASRLRELGGHAFAGDLFRTLSRLSVRAVPRDPLVATLRRRLADERLAQVREQSDADPEWVAYYDAEISDLTTERDGLQADLDTLAAERDEAREEAHRLRRKANNSKDAAGGTTMEADDIAGLAPESWQDIAEAAALLPTDGFALTDRALGQLDDNPYPDAARMWSFLISLREAGKRYHELGASVGGELKDWCQEHYQFEISLHDGKLVDAKQHRFVYDGFELSREPHVKVDDYKDPSRCGRIYFAVDSERSRFVVDHIGLHDLY